MRPETENPAFYVDTCNYCYMKNKTIKSVHVLVSAFLIVIPVAAHSQESPLQLTMKSDKDRYKIGEEIILQCAVQNISDKVITFHPYSQKNIELLNMNGTRCIEAPLQTAVRSEPLVTLQPGKMLRYSLKGKILRRKGGIFYENKEGIMYPENWTGG